MKCFPLFSKKKNDEGDQEKYISLIGQPTTVDQQFFTSSLQCSQMISSEIIDNIP